MMVRYNINDISSELTDSQKSQLKTAEQREIICDEDCPELTSEMAKRVYRPGRSRSGNMVSLRIQVSLDTLEKAKTFGDDYMAILGQLLDDVVNEKVPKSQ